MTLLSPSAEPVLTSALQRPWQDYALLLLLSTIFAFSFPMTKVAVSSLSPYIVVFCRLAVASAILLTILIASGHRFPKGRIWVPIIASGAFGHTIPFTLISWGQQQVDAGIAAILMAVMPLFTLGMAYLFTRDEKPNRWSFAGFGVALVGIVVLIGPDRLLNLTENSLRQYAIAAAAMCYGINAIVTKKLIALPWQAAAASFMLVAFVTSIPLLLVTDISIANASWDVWVAIAYLGLMPTAFAAVLIVFLVKRAGASFLSQINFVVPVLAVFFAVAFFGERLPANAWTALVIILAGVALARRRPKRKTLSINKGA